MISASSKGLTLVVCPVVKFVMVSSSTTKQPEKQRFFSFDTFFWQGRPKGLPCVPRPHLTHLTPPKNTPKKRQEFLLIKKKLETFLLQKYEQLSTEVFPPTFVNSERRYFSLSKQSTNPMKTNMEPQKIGGLIDASPFFKGIF